MLTLPKEEGGTGTSVSPVDLDKPIHYIIRVVATDAGAIGQMTLVEEGSAAAAGKDLKAGLYKKPDGSDMDMVQVYQKELQDLYTGLGSQKKSGKLTLEIHPKLLQAYVVQLVDTGLRTGFTDISPVPIDKKDR